MMFNIEEAGERIAGWLIADNPAAPPTLIVVLREGRERRVHSARTVRTDLKDIGLHETGECGFVLDGSEIPDLSPETGIEIYEEASNTLLYRRAEGADAPIRLFHLETQSMPVYPLARHLSPMIQMIYGEAEMISDETLTNIMRLHWPSVLISGGVLLRNYEGGLQAQDYRRAIVLSDPRRELAARLIRLKSLAAEPASRTGWRALGQGSILEVFEGLDITDATSLGKAFRRLDDAQFFALADPTLRKLVAKTGDAPLDKHHVGMALDSLAGFDVLGFDDRLDLFAEGLEALVDREGLPRDPLPSPPELPAVMEALGECRPAAELLSLDEALHMLARDAFDKAAD